MKARSLISKLILGSMIVILIFTAGCASATSTPAPAAKTDAPAAKTQVPQAQTKTDAPVAQTQAPQAQTKVDVIKIGGLYPMSGQMGLNGQNMKLGHEFAVNEINNAGGIKCLGGAKLEMVWGDHQGKPEAGNAEMERLITKENVTAVAGAFDSGVAVTSSEIAERYKVPYIVSSALATLITERGLKYVFKTAPSMRPMAYDDIKFAMDEGAKKHLVLYHNVTAGELFKGYFEEGFKKYGITDYTNVTFQAGGTDFSDVIITLKKSDPDVIYLIADTSDAILLVKTMKELNYWPKMAVVSPGDGMADPSLIQEMGVKGAEGIFMTTDWYPAITRPGSQEKNAEFKKANDGKDMTGSIMTTYVATYIIAAALEKSCSTDPQKLAEVLRTTKFEKGQWNIMYPYVKFDETGFNETTANVIGQYQNGEMIPVYPSDYKVKDAIWPTLPWDKR